MVWVFTRNGANQAVQPKCRPVGDAKSWFFCQEESAPPEKMLATPVLNTNPNLTLTLNLSQMLTLTIDVFCMLSFVLSAFSHYCVSLLSESK